jgi:hypothetical protein
VGGGGKRGDMEPGRVGAYTSHLACLGEPQALSPEPTPRLTRPTQQVASQDTAPCKSATCGGRLGTGTVGAACPPTQTPRTDPRWWVGVGGEKEHRHGNGHQGACCGYTQAGVCVSASASKRGATLDALRIAPKYGGEGWGCRHQPGSASAFPAA